MEINLHFRQYQKTLKRDKNQSTQIPRLIIQDKPQTMISPNNNNLARKNKLQDVKSKLSTVFTNPLEYKYTCATPTKW